MYHEDYNTYDVTLDNIYTILRQYIYYTLDNTYTHMYHEDYNTYYVLHLTQYLYNYTYTHMYNTFTYTYMYNTFTYTYV